MKKYIILLLILSFLHLLFAIRTNAYFSVDDFAVLSYFKSHRILETIPNFLINGDIFGFRKVVGYLVFGVLFKTFGANYIVFDLAIFLIHSANLILLFLIAKKLSKNNFIAFFVSLIFNRYYLFYYSNIHEYLLVVFSLLTIYLFFTKPEKLYLSLTAFMLALLTKETAVFIPLILFALSFTYKIDRKKINYFFLISLLFGLNILYYFVVNKVVDSNFSYTLGLNIRDLVAGLIFYIKPLALLVIFLPAVIYKKYKSILVLITSLVSLIPAVILVNRRELYYLYLPFSFLMIYLSTVLPKPNTKNLILYAIIIFAFGGRDILPRIAWHDFPNVQKNSMQEAIMGKRDNLERDAKLMLETDTMDLFKDKLQ